LKKLITIISLSFLLSSCTSSTSENTTFDNCSNLDLSVISSDENSPTYMDEVAKLVEESTRDLVGKSEKMLNIAHLLKDCNTELQQEMENFLL
jgi:hypothetical protein